MSDDDATYIGYIAEDINAIRKACDLMEEALTAGNFVEVNGWLGQIREMCSGIDDNLEGFLDEYIAGKLGLTYMTGRPKQEPEEP